MGKKWEKKNTGINFKLYEVYSVVCFPFMACVNDKVWVNSYLAIFTEVLFVLEACRGLSVYLVS